MSMDLREASRAIEISVREILWSMKLYQFDSYGWKSPDEIDPNYLGFAMWCTDPPFDILRFAYPGDKRAEPLKLPQWLEGVAVAGADLEGLMDAAWRSIGNAHFQNRVLGEPPDSHHGMMGVYLLSAIFTLGAASDRVRELFVASVFRMKAKEYEMTTSSNVPNRKRYMAPFAEAIALNMPDVNELINDLHGSALKIVECRKVRNKRVHEIATGLGQLEKGTISRATRGYRIGGIPEFGSDGYRQSIEQANAERNKKLASELNFPVDWYRSLVSMSNKVFEIEHRLRKKPKLTD